MEHYEKKGETIRQKARELNLDPQIYGTFAEIGAGQEVARQFFRAGNASGTVAKTVSAYDMQMSDAMYGVEQSGRYVTRTRLENMLDAEFTDLIKRVAKGRSPDSTFFAFADTVAAKTLDSDKDCQGWMGIRYQPNPGAAPSQVVLHVRMRDVSNRDQQECLGILGVNLIYGAFKTASNPDALVDGLIQGLSWGRVEVDFIDFSGPGFEAIDNSKMNLRLVTSSLSPVVMFTPNGEASVPTDLIYRKDVLILRGVFRPFSDVQKDMVRCGIETFTEDLATSAKNVICFCEMNVAKYLSEGLDDVSDLEARVIAMTGKGLHVMVTSHFRYFRLSEYFTRHDKRRIGFILSAENLQMIFDDRYYAGMEGGILEAMGRLFASDSKLLVYPTLMPGEREMVTAKNITVPPHQKYLYQHLLQNARILSLAPDPDTVVPFKQRVDG